MSQPDHKALSRGWSTDMSAEAIRRRLRIVDELYQLGKRLSRARPLGEVGEPAPAPEPPSESV